MSFCPTKDIHSIYLDNELPEVYKAEYEKHLTECAKCRSEFEKLKALRQIFKLDAEAITPDQKFLDDSYERLMIKMSYNRNSKKVKKASFFKVKYVASAAAAAAVLALIIPMGINSKKNMVTPSMAPVDSIVSMQQSTNNMTLNSGKNVVVSGNIDGDVLSSDFYDCSAVDLLSNVRGIDVLRPRFNEDNIISIRVTIPSVGEIPVNPQINLNGVVLSGNYKWNHLEK